MDKKLLIEKFVAKLSADLQVLTQAALGAHEAATHEESKAEDQYDTRGLEASYLAGAQSKRAMEIQEVIDIFRHTDLRKFSLDTPISATALVELSSSSKHTYHLLMPKGGGVNVEHEGKLVHVITPQSPMGAALLGKKVGDEIDVHTGKTVREYEIVSVS